VASLDVETTVRLFIQAWNTADDGERHRLLSRCCAPDARFSSPQGEPLDVMGLSRSIHGFLSAFPNAEVSHGPPDAHNGFARFRWLTQFNEGEREPIFGDDYVEFGAEGLILRVVSFDGRVKEVGD